MMSLPDSRLAEPRGVFVEKPKANVYTVMLVISLVALIIGCLCMYGMMRTYDMDWKATSARIVQ